MDTNQNNGQNYQINAFVKGMNSDTSLDQVSNEQYLFGRNIRITNNALLTLDINSNNKEGIVTPIVVGKSNVLGIPSGYIEILATASIGNIGAIILKKQDNTWDVYKLQLNNDEITPTLLFSSKETTNKKLFSVVINKEQENLIKLYIADGDKGIMLLFLQHPTISDLSSYYDDKEIDDLISHKYFPRKKVVITGVIGGQLKTSQVQYTYRLYQKYGTFSKLAPLTNKILIINNNRNTEEGNAEDTKTSMGFSLLITNDKLIFDHIQVYRIQYIKAGQLPEINLIKDLKLQKDEEKELNIIKIDDTGLDSLQQLSLDEFSALDGQDIIPTVIESNQGYLFGANVKDTTVFDLDVDVSGININLVKTKVPFSIGPTEFPDIDNTDDGFKYVETDEYIEKPINEAGVHERGNEWELLIDGPGLDTGQTETGGTGGPSGGSGSGSTSDTETTTGDTETTDNDEELLTNDNTDSRYKYTDYLSECYIQTTDSFKPEKNYNNIFTSSLLRSLRRGETYRYGIVFYNKNGQKTYVHWIKDVSVDDLNNQPLFDVVGLYYEQCWTNSLGIEIVIPETLVNELVENDVVGYEIVRCLKTNEYSTILLQCALSRPVHQRALDSENLYTSYYPLPFITTDYMRIYNESRIGPDFHSDIFANFHSDIFANNLENNVLYQAFCPEHLYLRTNTILSLQSSLELCPLYRLRSKGYGGEIGHLEIDTNGSESNTLIKYTTSSNSSYKDRKFDSNCLVYYFDKINLKNNDLEVLNILNAKDVKNPTWESGFTNILNTGTNSSISSGVKAYKSYSTVISDYTYINWISNGKYDLPISNDEEGSYNFAQWVKLFKLFFGDDLSKYKLREYTDSLLWDFERKVLKGAIGPGPVCFLLKTSAPEKEQSIFTSYLNDSTSYLPGSIIANITHDSQMPDKQYSVYYGFGNYRNIKKYEDNRCVVFDGDIYGIPCEFTSMFKAWDFRSIADYIESGQVVNYIPMETKINTFFDYGMNYRNTQSANLQLEPGTIPGVATQDRPLHQYNPIYSDNDTSVSVYYAQPLEKTQNIYPHRIVYSQQKTNGENIDNWNIFKPIDFVDADTRYGEITELMTVNDILYFWQNTAFGKLSVNERSLITDENSNTIQLGQGGVLQRTDYISTKYGMRPEDYSATEAEGGVYWIDILNKAIVAYLQGRVINYGEYTNVQNIINNFMSEEIPQIDYDLLNMELLCKCFYNKEQESKEQEPHEQLVFSTKLGCATSLYNRSYDNIINFNNVLYGLYEEESQLKVRKLNYLTNNLFNELLQPEELSFVVNSSPSQTKVFDNQKIVTLKRDYELGDRMDNKTLYFETDLNQASGLKEDEIKEAGVYTDREGNICYTIPREEDNIDTTIGRPMPLRLRGKWMKVDIKDLNPQQDFAISHVITKFRQSYS